MKNISNNFANCISKYLQFGYNIDINEYFCFIMGATLDLQLLSYVNMWKTVQEIDFNCINDYVIIPNNPFALENFCNSFNSLYRTDQNNDKNDIRWFVWDHKRKNNNKLVVISNSLLDDKNNIGNIPIYALVNVCNINDSKLDIESLLDIPYKESNYRGIICSVSIHEHYKLEIPILDFIKYWRIDNDESFNTNRFDIIPPKYKNFESIKNIIINDALLKQYCSLTQSSNTKGIKLIENLKEHLLLIPSQNNLLNHKNLLYRSINYLKNAGFNDMNYIYFSECLTFLDKKNIISNNHISNKFYELGVLWVNISYQLSQSTRFEVVDLIRIYDKLIQLYNESIIALGDSIKV